ncbi:MAG TPA: hypothetical protein VE978_10470 [Chitinophagales bacterium]|nr:hypothetical protein [Chitinophagales bacterium]
MVPEFEQLISRIEKLSSDDQKRLAALIENELKWDETFAASEDKLAILAEEALKEHREGRTRPFEEL